MTHAEEKQKLMSISSKLLMALEDLIACDLWHNLVGGYQHQIEQAMRAVAEAKEVKMLYAVYKIARHNEQGITVYGTEAEAQKVAEIISDAEDEAGLDLAMPAVTLTDAEDADYNAADYISEAQE